MTTQSARANVAEELETQVDDHLEERGQILLEAAHAWRLAGDNDLS